MAAPKGNKYAVGADSGRPRKFETAADMQAAIDEYFAEADLRGAPYTIEGLCNILDIDRSTLLRYGEREDEFRNTVKKAKAKVLQNLVERGLTGDGAPSVTIFLLKNNHGYEDRSVNEIKDERIIRGLSKDAVAEALSDEVE
jgi:hypothetical protein